MKRSHKLIFLTILALVFLGLWLRLVDLGELVLFLGAEFFGSNNDSLNSFSRRGVLAGLFDEKEIPIKFFDLLRDCLF